MRTNPLACAPCGAQGKGLPVASRAPGPPFPAHIPEFRRDAQRPQLQQQQQEQQRCGRHDPLGAPPAEPPVLLGTPVQQPAILRVQPALPGLLPPPPPPPPPADAPLPLPLVLAAAQNPPSLVYAPPPKRPGFGKLGRSIQLFANHFKTVVSLREGTLARTAPPHYYSPERPALDLRASALGWFRPPGSLALLRCGRRRPNVSF